MLDTEYDIGVVWLLKYHGTKYKYIYVDFSPESLNVSCRVGHWDNNNCSFREQNAVSCFYLGMLFPTVSKSVF